MNVFIGATGVLLSITLALPSCPLLFLPQHLTPLKCVVQVCAKPADTAETLLLAAMACAGVALSLLFPLPSCPSPFSPQHCTPAERLAQV